MKDSITLLRRGFYTSIQDKGRFGYAHAGVPESGAMDRKAMQLANTLVNNPQDEAVLEYTLVGPSIQFNCDRHFVITGAITLAILDKKPIKNNTVYIAHKGQTLTLTKVIEGCRGYVAIAGGLQSVAVLGSKSMYLPVTKISKLDKSIEISIGTSAYGSKKLSRIKIQNSTDALTYIQEQKCPVYKGPEFNLMDAHLRNYIETTKFSISKLWNRMAIQLEETMPHDIPSIVTGPVIPGTVQLTPSGRMILLMRDCQTTGGYPRILQLSEDAMHILAQKKQGDVISLLLVN